MTDEPKNLPASRDAINRVSDQEPQAEHTNGSLVGQTTESKYGKIKHISIVNEMEKSYLDYAMSVIVARALPDVRDGLKPVHRRILYSMFKSGIHHSSSYKKSARIVGDVLGKYHPHGDSAVYLALVRLAQDFSMRYPLIDGQGNFGSVDGDSPAAMRYTEARLAKITQELLADINKNTVPFVDNFDGSMKEPSVLPTRLPNMLLMGSEGIAVGMATKIPPHNLTEVSKAILFLIEKGKAHKLESAPQQSNDSVSQALSLLESPSDYIAAEPSILAGEFNSEGTINEIMTYINGPDFPTAGIIYDFKEIIEGYRTGKGRVLIRAKAEIVEGKKGYQILVTELPYQVNKARLIMKIADLVKDKKIEGIRDLNDDSDRTGMQITIDLKRDAIPKVILNKLFKYTELQTSFPMNMVALNSEGVPQLMNIKQILTEYIAHRQLVIVKRSQYELKEAESRAHILEGLLIALKNLDDVIQTIRNSADQDIAKNNLMKKFGLSEIQSLAILDMQLKRLAALERQKIEDEYNEIKKTIEKLLKLLSQPARILKVVADETQEMITLYGDKRRTKLIKGKAGEFSEEDLVANERTVITLTESGYIKRVNPSSYRAQARGGKGARGMTTKAEDVVMSMLTANTHDNLLLFTNQGRVFKMKVYEMPETSRQAKGNAVVNLVALQPNEKVQSLLILQDEVDDNKFIILATRKGLVKKTAVKLYDNIRQTGIIAITLNDNDELIGGRLTSGDDHIILVTREGKSIHFSEEEVNDSHRDTKGVKGITIKKDDFVVSMESFPKDADKPSDGRKKSFRQIFVVTENGLGKRSNLSEYPLQKRSGIGVKVASLSQKTGKVAAARMLTQDHEAIFLTTKSGQAIKLPVSAKSIPVLTRPTQGVILMRPKNGDKIVTAAVAVRDEAVDGEETQN